LENAPAAVEAAAKRGARPARADKKLERYPTWSETALSMATLRLMFGEMPVSSRLVAQ